MRPQPSAAFSRNTRGIHAPKTRLICGSSLGRKPARPRSCVRPCCAISSSFPRGCGTRMSHASTEVCVNSVDTAQQLLLQSGASWVLWLLAGLSVVSLGICVERWFFYRTRHCNVQALARSVSDHLAAHDVDAATETL